VEALPLISKRRMLGIVIPMINIPFFIPRRDNNGNLQLAAPDEEP
jgi:hypothetical protein